MMISYHLLEDALGVSSTSFRLDITFHSFCLWQGHALCSHLGQEDTVDIFFYLTHAGLLHLTAHHRLHQLLVWQEIFPTRLCHDVTDTNSVFGYSEPYARWFLMVVGMVS